MFLCAHVYSLDIAVGTHIGMEASVNTPHVYSSNNVASITVSTNDIDWAWPSSTNFSFGVFTNLNFKSWFSIQSAFNTSINRHLSISFYDVDSQKIYSGKISGRVYYHSFDFDLVAQFYIMKHWYVGLGTGMTLNTVPRVAIREELSKNRFKPSGSTHIGVNFIFNTGVYIPVTKEEKHYIMLGLRGVIDILGIAKVSNHTKLFYDNTNENRSDYLTNTSWAVTPLAMSFNIGYLFKF